MGESGVPPKEPPSKKCSSHPQTPTMNNLALPICLSILPFLRYWPPTGTVHSNYNIMAPMIDCYWVRAVPNPFHSYPPKCLPRLGRQIASLHPLTWQRSGGFQSPLVSHQGWSRCYAQPKEGKGGHRHLRGA